MMRIVRQLNARRMHSPQTERDEIRRFHELMRATTREGYLSRLRILRDYDIRDAAAVDRRAGALSRRRSRHARAVGRTGAADERADARATVRVLEGHGHSCLIAPDMDLAAILADWMDRADR